MANKAGKAKLGSILPLPISTPINVPITCAITAPGPNSGERIGKEQMNPMTIKPQTLPANGIIIFANRLPPLQNLEMALMPGDPIITVWPEQRFGEYAAGLYAIVEEEPKATLKDYGDAIDYAVKKIGIDHVGISSDFNDGGGLDGWKDVSETRNVTAELLQRGYSEADIAKLWGGNFLRVWDTVQKAAKPVSLQ